MIQNLSEAEELSLRQAEISWHNIRALPSTMTFERYLEAAGLTFPPEYVELVKARDPFAAPKRAHSS